MEIRRIFTKGIRDIFLLFCFFSLVKPQVINLSVKCESDTLYIQCSSGLVIEIQKANFGRLNKDICVPSDVTNCASSTSTDIAASICDNLVSCSLQATVSVFGDACPGVDKYLFVSHACIEPVTKLSSNTTTDDSTLTNSMKTSSVDEQIQHLQDSTTTATITKDHYTRLYDQITTINEQQTSRSTISRDGTTMSTFSSDSQFSSLDHSATTNNPQTSHSSQDVSMTTKFTSDNQILYEKDSTTNNKQTSRTSQQTTKLLTSTDDNNITPNSQDTATSENQILENYQATTVDVNKKSCPCFCDSETFENNTDSRPKPINRTSSVEITDLVLDKKVLSSAIRKKISASDNRSSATLFGYIGVVVLVSVFSFLLTLDILTIILPKRRQYCGRHRFI